MTTVLLGATSDAWVAQTSTAFNSGASKALSVTGSGSGVARYSYIYFNRPFELLVTVQSGLLRLKQKGAATGGSRQLAAHLVASGWKESTLTYANRPATTGSSVLSAAQGDGGTDGRVWEIDVTTLLQQVSDGAAYYGFRISSTITTALAFFSSEADDWEPELEIEFSEAPQVPTDLSPSNGRAVSVARTTLRMDFTDHSGDTSLSAVRIQMNQGAESETPSVDTGEVPAETPEWLLDFDVAIGATWFWRGEVIDGAGLGSGLSEWESFTRVAKPVVTIVSPAGFVSEPTPPFIASVTGGTQVAAQWFVTDPDDASEVLWDSKKVTSADLSITLPATSPPLLTPGGEYGLLRRTWDAVAREGTAADPVSVDTFTTFTYNLTTAVAPVTALTVTAIEGSPDALAEWVSATAPDSYSVLVDGVAYEINIDPVDVLDTGTSYEYLLRGLSPRREHSVKVLRVVNGETSDTNPVDTVTTNPKGVWLSTFDGLHTVCLSSLPGDSQPVSFEPNEVNALYKPFDATNAVLITQAILGRSGHVKACLYGNEDDTLDEQLAEWEAMKDRKKYGSTPFYLVLTNTAMRVVPYNRVEGAEDEFDNWAQVDFDYFEFR